MTKPNDPPLPEPVAHAANPARIKAFHTGISAESRACVFLLTKGYRILARRFRTPHGEIDVVAKRLNTLVFVEVKARATIDEAAWAVSPRQQQRIASAADVWLMTHPDHANLDCRFDAILIAPKRFPRHLKAAFDTTR